MPKTLLLADDSVTIQKVVGISFANEDVEIVTVDNGDDAVARARELRPDLILADVVMPGLSGYEVCHAIKSDPELRGIPVLLLTGTFETFDEVQANEVGADGHITKPFEAQVLVDHVNSLLASSRGAAVSASLEEPEPLGLTGMVTAGEGSEPYDLFEDDVTAPSGTADAPMLDSPPTTVLVGGEPLGEAAASGPQAPVSHADASFGSDSNALTSDQFAGGPDLFSTADDPDGGTVLLDPASANAPELLTGEDDVLESGEPLGDAPLITANPDTANDGDALLLEDELADPGTVQSPIEPAADHGSANRFGVSEPADVFASEKMFEPSEVSDPAGPSDPNAATTLFDEPPPAPDAPTAFEFGAPDASTQEPMFDPSPSFTAEPPALDADLFSEGDSPQVPDLFATDDESAAPGVVADSTHAVSPGMLYDDDPMGQTTLDPEAGRSYDVSSSDLGASDAVAPPAPIMLPSEPNWPPDPEAASREVETEHHEATPPALSPMLEQQVHDAVEKMAWDAFGNLAERIIKDAVERIEKVAWEVIPQITESLVQEEIRKLKGEE